MPEQNPGSPKPDAYEPAQGEAGLEHDASRTVVTRAGSATGGASMHFQTGDLIDNVYRVLELLGSGGAGQVYRVEQTNLKREAALKLLNTSQMDEQAWRRFHYEAQLIGKLNHPNIIQVYNFGIHEDRLPYYVMELVKGDTLDNNIKKFGAVGTLESTELFLDICSALAYAHEKGIVHRDIKPGNIVLVQSSGGLGYKAKLLDFGIAKLKSKQNYQAQGLTMAGEVVGSPLYMSPEQCQGQSVDERSDVYSLGCTIFETMTGSPPFRGESIFATVMMHFNDEPPTLKSRVPDEYFPPRLEELIQKSMAKDPDQRFQSMTEMAQALAAIKDTLTRNLSSKNRGAAATGTAGSSNMQIDMRVRGGETTKYAKIREADNRQRLIKTLLAVCLLTAVGFGAWQVVTTLMKKPEKEIPLDEIGATDRDFRDYRQDVAKVATPKVGSYLQLPLIQRGETLVRHYKFPETPKTGQFFITTSKEKKTYNDPTELDLPIDQFVSFKPTGDFCLVPQRFEGFDSSMPNELNFQIGKGDSSDIFIDIPISQILKHCRQIKALYRLEASGTNMNDDDLITLESFPNLRVLHAERTALTPAALAKSKILAKLKGLHIDLQPPDYSVLLEAIARHQTMDTLALTGHSLDEKEVSALCKATSLRALSLVNSNIDEHKLQMLARSLKHLGHLNLRKNAISSNSMNTLAQFKQMGWLILPQDGWSPRNQEKMRALLPAAKIEFTGPATNKKTPLILDQ
ncbi:MAG TPA: protein kinase [Candidatus Obscuribacter sp.]|nr:protein kinase [Candidatus Obscuribacter sp.]HND69579.1 protein kinase [Candidatus Obscuribacter sp.]